MPGALFLAVSLMTSTEFSEHQRRRWMRPDAYKFVRPDWRRFARPGCEAELHLALFGTKYSPDQPRVPAGNPDGGQWTGGSEDLDVNSILEMAKQLAATTRSNKYLKCLDLCYPILERPQPPGVDANDWDFHRCMAACMGE